MVKQADEQRAEVADAGEAPAPDDAARPPRSLLREYFESGVVTLVMALFFMTFVAQAAEVPSASMENTIYVGDRFLINKFIFGAGAPVPLLPQRDIRRGDIVVFKYPAPSVPSQNIVQYETLFIKRVIALPGETVEVRGAEVYVNGQLLPEHDVTARDVFSNDKAELKDLVPGPPKGDAPYTVYHSPAPATRGFTYAVGKPFPVPPDHYFMMGDNRDNSADSRVWGPVPRELIVGRGLFVIWSYDESRPRSRAVPPFNFISDFFTNTRWGRIGTMLR